MDQGIWCENKRRQRDINAMDVKVNASNRIYQLPDHIIHQTVSFLPTIDVVRISILSKNGIAFRLHSTYGILKNLGSGFLTLICILKQLKRGKNSSISCIIRWFDNAIRTQAYKGETISDFLLYIWDFFSHCNLWLYLFYSLVLKNLISRLTYLAVITMIWISGVELGVN